MRWLALLLLLLSDDAAAFELAVGAKATTATVRRGATFYDDIQLAPVIFAGFFEQRLQLLLLSVEYNDFIAGRWLRARTKLEPISDEPLYRTRERIGPRNARETTVEWTQTLELFAPSFDDYRYGGDVRLVQDLLRHGGTHFELTPRVTLARLGDDRGRPLLQPQLFTTLGVATAAYNRYFYGREAVGGFNYAAAGLRVLLPGRFDPAFWALELSRFEVIGDNRKGRFLDGKTGGWRVEATAAFRVW